MAELSSSTPIGRQKIAKEITSSDDPGTATEIVLDSGATAALYSPTAFTATFEVKVGSNWWPYHDKDGVLISATVTANKVTELPDELYKVGRFRIINDVGDVTCTVLLST